MTTPPPAAAPTPPARWRFGRLFLGLSLLANLGLAGLAGYLAVRPIWPDDADDLAERHYVGTKTAADKIAVVRIAGVLVDGNTAHAHRQLAVAARDKAVKAVVLRIDSPGGTISASEDLHRAITDLRDDKGRVPNGGGPKPVVASMGGIAASGGYYVAMPAKTVVAEPTTITGSIGVFAALPNVAGLADRNGVKVELIKAGGIKAGGSMFHTLTPDERQPWQDMVDHAYDRFVGVVAAGRPGLTKERLVGEKTTRTVPKYDEKGNPTTGPDGKPATLTHTRYRADGGTYTPEQAKQLGLIDDIADLPAAVKLAAAAAGLTDYRAVTYDRPKSPVEYLLGMQAATPAPTAADALAAAVSPKLWYLTPGYESAGVVSSVR